MNRADERGRVLFLLAGPAVWLASLGLLLLIGARGCAATGTVLTIQFVAIALCVALLYRALSRVRNPALAGDDRARLWHFMAGGTAVLSMAAIGASAFFATLSASC